MAGTGIIHIIDDDQSLREALGRLLRSVGHMTELYESVADFTGRYRPASSPSCLLLDVRLPGMSGIEFQRQLRDQGGALPVVMMTGHGDIQMSVQAMKAGAIDFLAKPFRDQDLLDAVAVALGKAEAEIERKDAVASLRARFDTLSPREREVMGHVARGRLNKQIAGDLGLSEITVKIHRGAMMRKLAVRTVADLVRVHDQLAAGERYR